MGRTEKEISQMSLNGLIRYKKTLNAKLGKIKSSMYCDCCDTPMWELFPNAYTKSEFDKKIKPIKEELTKIIGLINEKSNMILPYKKNKEKTLKRSAR